MSNPFFATIMCGWVYSLKKSLFVPLKYYMYSFSSPYISFKLGYLIICIIFNIIHTLLK